MRRFALVGALAIAGFLVTGRARAASFDCAKAASHVEHMVCDDVSLSALDGQMAEAYAGALDRSIRPEQVTASQRAWLRSRADCADQKCLSDAYARQLARLAAVSDEPTICADGTTPAVNACTQEYARRADAELGRYLTAGRKRIDEDMADASEQALAKRTRAAFDASQAAWTAYRKAECEAVYENWSEGTIRGAMYGSCMEDVTKARTLQVWNAWLTYMDDTPAVLPKPVERTR